MSYEESQLTALRGGGLLGGAVLALLALFATTNLPSTLRDEPTDESVVAGPAAS